jgi:YD repeat-containing protein
VSDDRGRLVGETRVVNGTTTVYDLSYTYDQLGNRLTKTDAVAQLRTDYTYDVQLDPEDPSQWPGYPGPVYPTHNNRLLYYELYDTSQTPEKLLRTVSYTYWDTGEASNITIKDEDPTGGNDPAYDWHNDLALYYEGGRQTMRMALWDRWQTDGNGEPIPETYEMAHAREFRYEWAVGSPRERYLTVDGNPNAPNTDPNHPETYGLIEPVRRGL